MSYSSLSRTVLLGFSAIILTVALEGYVNGQTATYHLHKEASSTSGLDQLKTAGPDAASVALTSVNLKSLANGEYIIKAFDTQSGVPNISGVIPGSSTVTFTLWMSKTANVGTMFPRAKLNLNSAAGTSLCTSTGSSGLTTTLTKYTLTCTTASNISMAATDRFYLWVGVNLTAGSTSTNFQGSINIEGTLNGNYDSQIIAPLPITPPSISGLSVSSGPVGTSVTVNGSNFGATQGTSTLKFNGVAATPTSWSASSIAAPVPSGATTGPVVVAVRGVPSNGVNFTVTPKINSLSPTSGPVATSVTISGTTFGATQGSSTVTFNGTTATPTSWSATSIAVPAPANATTGPVVVTVSGQASNGVTFTVTPKINSLSPTAGAVGTSVTISGTTFGATQGSSTVTFNGTTATPTSWSATSIAAPVPASATTGSVVVTVSGQASNGVTFTVTPKINSLSPTSGAVGTSVTISGTTFGATQGTSSVTFNGTTATPTSWSATSIAVPVPANATNGPVVVTVSGQASNGVTFTVTPKINSLSPTSGSVGTSVTVSGTTFGATQGTSTVTFNGTTATPTSWSATSIAAPVPANATTGPVVVTVSGQASNGVTFTVTPKVDSLSPSSGGIGDSVTINGTAFGATQGTSTVAFNGTTGTPTSWSATSIAVPVPANATTGPVVVTVSGQASNGVTFTVTPKINSLSPTSGAVGTSITISGTSFGATQGSSTISFNGTVATPSSWTDTSIVAPVPAGASTGPVVVTVGVQASNAVTFTLAPKIDSLSPTSGGIGTSITITGTDFGTTQGASTLTFNGTQAAPTSWSTTSIVAPVPSGATTGPVVVTVGGSPSNGPTFTILTTGTISGRITAADGTTPISGATVKALQGATIVATATTNGTGDYSITPVDAGTYTMTASATGYGTKSRGLVIVTGGGTATVNLSLDAIVNGPVSYIYDAAGRLISTVGPTDTVVYDYDAVGNLLSISRQSSNQVSIIQLSPSSGPIGTTVTISGTGFSANASQNTVTFNGVAATITSATTTQIVAGVPSGAATGPVGVTSPNGSATSAISFTVTGDQGAPTISGFTPTIGSPTTPVTISGNNFDTVAYNDRVKFNVSSAGATSATATSIGTSVPTGGSGRISVTTPLGTATSTADFFIPPSGSTPADFEVIGRMAFPGSQTVTINTAGKKAMILFDGMAGQRMSLDPTNNTIGISTLSIFKPDGTLWTSNTMYTWSANFFDTQNLPATGTYTIFIDTNTYYSGSMTLNLYNVPPDITGPITYGSSMPVTIATPGQNARLTFSGSAGQKVSLNVSGVTITNSNVSILNPDSSTLAGTVINANGQFFDNLTLPTNGTYTIVLDPWGAYIGNATLSLYDSSDLVLPITPGGSAVTVTTTGPGQNAKLNFSGTTGQRVSLKMTNISFPDYGCIVYLRDPVGSTLAQFQANSSTTSGFIDTQTLSVAGTYSVWVDPNYLGTGSIVLTLYDVPPDESAAITIGGLAVTLTTTTPGQNGNLSFTGSAGQQISLTFSRTMAMMDVNTSVTIKKPDGTTLVGPVGMGPSTSLIDQQTLPTTGTYTIFADPYADNTGSMTFTLWDASDVTGTIIPGGSPITVTTNAPGQNARLTFSGNAGQKVSLILSNVAISASVSILNPDGTTLANLPYLDPNGGFIDAKTLSVNGTYTILVDGGDTSTGSVTLTLYDASDVTGSVVIGGSAVNVTTTVPGQNAKLTFDGTAGQQITVHVRNNNLFNALVSLVAPDGTVLTYNYTSGSSLDLATQILPVAGTYTIVVDPWSMSTGSMDVNVTNP